MSERRIVLASASPRRRELLQMLNIEYAVLATNAAETPQPNETAPALVTRLSQAKAESAQRAAPNAIIIACDTDVELEGKILGKPRAAAEAKQMLRALRGRAHSVYGGITICPPSSPPLDKVRQPAVTFVVHTRVWMRDYTDAEIDAYVATGDPLDKAAAYGVQHPVFQPVARIEGCFANVMGLALCRLYHALADRIKLPAPRIECHSHPEANCSVPRLMAHR